MPTPRKASLASRKPALGLPDPSDLPPLPDTPPPVPEGEVLGLPGVPEEATAAVAIPDVEDLAPSETVVDPVTGAAGVDLGTTKAGRSAELKAELEAADRRRAAEAAALAAGAVHAPEPVSAGRAPVQQARLDEHAEAQRAYKAERDRLRRQAAPVAEAVDAEELSVETPAEQAARAKAEAKEAYEARVAAMGPDEPRYVATGRAPRPKVCGHVLSAGDVVPGAYLYTRLDSWINNKLITPA